jgi:hypothetical protein
MFTTTSVSPEMGAAAARQLSLVVARARVDLDRVRLCLGVRERVYEELAEGKRISFLFFCM